MPRNAGGYVYGTILVATLLAAEGRGHEGYGRVVGSVALALVVYWLAIAYAEDAGRRAGAGTGPDTHFSPRGFADTARHELAVVIGALGPLIALLLAWAFGASPGTGIAVGVFSAAGIIALTEVWLGVRSHLDGRDLVVQTGFGVLLGLLVVGLRVLLH